MTDSEPTPGPSSPSSSLSPSPVVPNPVGRPRKSVVWDYFIYDSIMNKSTCQILVTSDSNSGTKLCGHSITGKYPTNLKQPLKKTHLNEYKEVESKEAEVVRRGKMSNKNSPYGQRTLSESFRRKYDRESERYKLLTRKLALYVGGTNVPNSIVENVIFKSLLEAFDPRYLIPGRTRIGKEIDKVMSDMKERIEVFLSQSQKISLCADIWTKKGMTSSYLGITAHFFSSFDRKRHQVTLAVRKMPHPHNAEHILEVTETLLP